MSEWALTTLGEALTPVKRPVSVADLVEVPWAGARWYAEGIYARTVEAADNVKAKTLNRLEIDDITYNRMWATKAAFGVVGQDSAGCLVTADFPIFVADRARLLPEYMRAVFQSPNFQKEASARAVGTTERRRLKEPDFLAMQVALPSPAEQRRIVDLMEAVDAQIDALAAETKAARILLRAHRSELLVRESATVPVKNAFSVLMGRQRAPQHAIGPYMTNYLRSANIGDDVLDLADIKQMNFNPDERAKFGLRVGDVLVSEGSASAAAVGLSAVWHGDIEGPVCFQKTLLRFRAIDGVSTAAFTNHWCQWAFESGTLLKISSGTNIKHITAVRVLEVPVALPGIEEQSTIADELDRLKAQHSALSDELAHLRTFRSVVLASLLSGEIELPESYDALLEKVS